MKEEKLSFHFLVEKPTLAGVGVRRTRGLFLRSLFDSRLCQVFLNTSSPFLFLLKKIFFVYF